MTRYNTLFILILFLSFLSSDIIAQFKLPFGDVKLEELSNKPYKPDPGADAVILSDIGIASLNYVSGFYLEMERDVRIRIVNSNGYDYADIEIPFSKDDDLILYRASTFNIKNGEKVETKIGKKSFIIENATSSDKVLKFNFPDVHEGSVIEYSYVIKYKNNAVYTLVPWAFQSEIPVVNSSLTVSYPESCVYKTIISGSASGVATKTTRKEATVFGIRDYVTTSSWVAQNIPAFREEPYILSRKEHLTKLTFELASINFKGSSYEEITPTYASLTTKLLEKDDFGRALRTDFKKLAEKLTIGLDDNLAKLKKLHEYISSGILWNGENDYTVSASLRAIQKKEKGNSADINIMLIAMLRSIGIKADPVILSTRSNGKLNLYSAMIQQFDYLVAYVSVDGEFYLVDATDPLRPYTILPFDCLNDKGRLISEYDSKFIDLKNREKEVSFNNYTLSLDKEGNLSGSMENRYSDYTAYNIRKIIKLESEEGYIDMIKSASANIRISDFKIENMDDPYSELVERCNISISNGTQIAGNEIIFNPYLSLTGIKNPFVSAERKFPVNFGYPMMDTYSLRIKVPDGYIVTDKPENISFNSGKDDLKFDFTCNQEGNEIVIKSVLSINKNEFQLSEYASLRSFYSKMLRKNSELIILKKNSAS